MAVVACSFLKLPPEMKNRGRLSFLSRDEARILGRTIHAMFLILLKIRQTMSRRVADRYDIYQGSRPRPPVEDGKGARSPHADWRLRLEKARAWYFDATAFALWSAGPTMADDRGSAVAGLFEALWNKVIGKRLPPDRKPLHLRTSSRFRRQFFIVVRGWMRSGPR